MQQTAPILNRPDKLMLVVPKGASVTTFGDALVVAHELHPPVVYNRHTGDRMAIAGFSDLPRLERTAFPPCLELVPQ